MSIGELAAANLLSPAILLFVLGALGVLLRSDLRLPDEVFAALSIYLMLAIGFKGGVELSTHPLDSLSGPLAAAFALGCLIPLWCYALLRRFVQMPVADAAALAAHYGSVSAVTFAAVTTFLEHQSLPYEGFAPALLAVMEVPAIVVAIALAGVAVVAGQALPVGGGVAVVSTGPASPAPRLPAGALRKTLSSKSIVLLVGGLVIGTLVGPAGMSKVKPLFVDLFQGLLCLYLLDLGRSAALRAGEFAKLGVRLGVFAISMPVLHAALGILVAHAVGMSEGGAIVLGTLAASASYIAAPAAVRLALPEANPSYYLTCSLAITFPFNIAVGIPLYVAMATWLYA